MPLARKFSVFLVENTVFDALCVNKIPTKFFCHVKGGFNPLGTPLSGPDGRLRRNRAKAGS